MELKQNHQDTVNGSEASASEMWYTTRGKMEMKLIRFSSYSQFGDKKNLQRFLCVFRIRKKGILWFFFHILFRVQHFKLQISTKPESLFHHNAHILPRQKRWVHELNGKLNYSLNIAPIQFTITQLSFTVRIIPDICCRLFACSTYSCSHEFWILPQFLVQSREKNSRRRHFQWLFRASTGLPPPTRCCALRSIRLVTRQLPKKARCQTRQMWSQLETQKRRWKRTNLKY